MPRAKKTEKQQEFKIATASEWKRKKTQEYVLALPSGVCVQAKSIDWVELAMDPKLADGDKEMVHRLLNGEALAKKGADLRDVMRRISKVVAPFIVTKPTLVTGRAKANEVSTDDLTTTDLMAIFSWNMGQTPEIVVKEVT